MPVARAKTWSPRFDELRLPPAAFAVVVGGRPRRRAGAAVLVAVAGVLAEAVCLSYNIHLSDRDGVRTPMQWSPDRNGGFSRASPENLIVPPIMNPVYGFEAVNVEAQER